MTKSTLTPIKIAKQIDSRNPRVQPRATRVDVTEHNTYPMVIVANSVKTKDRELKKMTVAAAATPAEPETITGVTVTGPTNLVETVGKVYTVAYTG